MKIVVCVKYIMHVYTQMAMDRTTQKLDEDGYVYQTNPYDEMAVEAAVQIKEVLPQGAIALVSLGPPEAENALRECLALGGDKMDLILDHDWGNSSPWRTASILSQVIKREKFDLVVCGKKSNDQSNGQVGIFLGEMLSIPSVSAVTQLDHEALKNGKVLVHRALEGGNREEVELTLPGLITIEKGMCIPRYPTLAATLNSQKAKVRIHNASDFEAQTKTREIRRISLSPPRPKPKNFFTPESSLSPEDRLKLALGGGITSKKGFQVTGAPREMSQKIFDWLKGNGLITEKTLEKKVEGDSNAGF